MASVWRQLGRPAMLSLARLLESEAAMPPSRTRLRQHIPEPLLDSIISEMESMNSASLSSSQLAKFLELLAEEREASQLHTDRLSLVWSGPNPGHSLSRDTSVVVKELFNEAKKSLLIASYAIDQGEKATALFGDLAARMDRDPKLEVQCFLNIRRKPKDERPNAILTREFSDLFRRVIWPGKRLPEVFYDPRSLEIGGLTRACLHAKCIVVDDRKAFLSSANFTEAAQNRNIEAGVVIEDTLLAKTLKSQFQTLLDQSLLQRLAGL
ncbi:MAG: DISARM system phospholipase D-like protein DrmC [Planctomycetota bacterium]|nr:DISARM system phospholipase D-like protein DrmC [Planctomycetota bacterium]